MGEFLEGLTGLAAVICIFGVPWITYHQRKMLEIKLRMGQQGDQNVLAELQELKRQMTEMRDTTTRYDMSFDAALQRLESRVGNMEQRIRQIESDDNSVQANRS